MEGVLGIIGAIILIGSINRFNEWRRERKEEKECEEMRQESMKSQQEDQEKKKPDTLGLMLNTLNQLGCQPTANDDGSISVQYQGENSTWSLAACMLAYGIRCGQELKWMTQIYRIFERQ